MSQNDIYEVGTHLKQKTTNVNDTFKPNANKRINNVKPLVFTEF